MSTAIEFAETQQNGQQNGQQTTTLQTCESSSQQYLLGKLDAQLRELDVELLEETLMVNQDKYGSDDRIDTLTAADSSNGLALSMAATDSLNDSQASTIR